MHAAQAHALRRAALVGAGLTATVVAHMGAVGGTGVHLLGIAPLVWCGLIAVAVICGPRARVYAPRHPVGTCAALAAAQLAMHVVVSTAPWALGLASPGMRMPAGEMITAGALWPHLLAALLLGAALVRADRWLARAVATVRRAVADLVTPRHGWPHPSRRAPLGRRHPRVAATDDVRLARGPPMRGVAAPA
jgi:hypothetical protein